MKILVIRFKHIGDVLLSSTLCASLKKSFANAEIDYFVFELSAPLFEHHPAIDNLITLSTLERKNPLRYLRKIWALSRNKYDIVIDATSTGKTELISLLCQGAGFRIGRYKKGRGFFYSHKIQKINGDKIHQRLSMLQPLIDAGFQIQYEDRIQLHLSEQERTAALAKFVGSGVDMAQTIIAFSVSSKYTYRMWNMDYMRKVAEHCLNNHNAQIVLMAGMPSEKSAVDTFVSWFGGHSRVFNNIEAPGLRDLLAVLSQCDLFVGNEGGPRHFAEAVGVPSVSICSPSAERSEWVPAGHAEHLSVDWRDVNSFATPPVYAVDDDTYHDLYNSILPQHVIPLIDKVLTIKP